MHAGGHRRMDDPRIYFNWPADENEKKNFISVEIFLCWYILVYIFGFCQQQYALVMAVEHILASLIFYSLLNLHDVKNIGCILTRIVNNGIKRGRRREFYRYLLPPCPNPIGIAV